MKILLVRILSMRRQLAACALLTTLIRNFTCAAAVLVLAMGCSASEGQVNEVQGEKSRSMPVSSPMPVVNFAGGAALLKGVVSVGHEVSGNELQNLTCAARVKTYQAVLQTMGQEILSWCNSKYPGDCAARKLCFETLTKRSSSQSISISVTASQKVSGSESVGSGGWPVNTSSTTEVGSQFAIAVQVKLTFGGGSEPGDSVVCQSPLKSAFGSGFTASLKQAFESSALGGFGASCAPERDLEELNFRIP